MQVAGLPEFMTPAGAMHVAGDRRNAQPDSDYCPLDSHRLRITMDLLAQRRGKQIHPVAGPERAFGKALRGVREARGISQEDLALEAGFDRTFISLLERGLRSPTIRTLVRLAEALKVQPSHIVRRMERVSGGRET